MTHSPAVKQVRIRLDVVSPRLPAPPLETIHVPPSYALLLLYQPCHRRPKAVLSRRRPALLRYLQTLTNALRGSNCAYQAYSGTTSGQTTPRSRTCAAAVTKHRQAALLREAREIRPDRRQRQHRCANGDCPISRAPSGADLNVQGLSRHTLASRTVSAALPRHLVLPRRATALAPGKHGSIFEWIDWLDARRHGTSAALPAGRARADKRRKPTMALRLECLNSRRAPSAPPPSHTAAKASEAMRVLLRHYVALRAGHGREDNRRSPAIFTPALIVTKAHGMPRHVQTFRPLPAPPTPGTHCASSYRRLQARMARGRRVAFSLSWRSLLALIQSRISACLAGAERNCALIAQLTQA